MKHCLYIHNYYQIPGHTSSSLRSHAVAEALYEAGYSVTVVTRSNNFKLRRTLIAKNNDKHFSIIYLPVPYSQSFAKPARILSFILFSGIASLIALLFPHDFVYASSTPLTVCIPALISKLLRGKPFIFEVRDLWPQVPIALGFLNSSISRKTTLALARAAYLHSSLVIPLSADMAKGIRESIANSSSQPPIHVATNFFSLAEFASVCKTGLSLQHLPVDFRNHTVILYPGTLGLVNNPYYLADLAYHLRDTEFVVLVVGDGNQRKPFLDYSIELNVFNKNLFFCDRMPRHQLLSIMKNVDYIISTVLPIPILSSNSANKFFEALASGAVPLINHGGWMKCLLEENSAGFALDPCASVAALQLREITPEQAAASSRNARQLALEYFSDKIVLSELVINVSRALS